MRQRFRENDASRRVTKRTNFVPLLLGLTLSACMVGPDYHAPDAPVPVAYKELQAGPSRSRRTRRIAAHGGRSTTIPSSTALERQVEVSNQTVKQFEAEYRNAVALVQEARAEPVSDGRHHTGRDAQHRVAAAAEARARSARRPTGGGRRRWRWGRPDDAIQHRGHHRLDSGRVGPRPPPGGKPGRRGAGQRRRPGERQALGADDAGSGLFRPARRGFARPTCCARPSPPTSRMADHAQPVSRRHQFAGG